MHGVEPFEIDFAARLASEGPVAGRHRTCSTRKKGGAFSEDDLQKRRRSMTDADVADVEATMSYLKQQSYVTPARIRHTGASAWAVACHT